MSIGRASVANPVVPLGNEGLIKVVDHFKYPELFCSGNGTNTKELNNWIGKASAAFRELDKIWKDRNINLDTKMKFYIKCLCSLLHPPVCCRVLDTHRDRWVQARVSDMRCQRKILRVTWSQHISNNTIELEQSSLSSHQWSENDAFSGLDTCSAWTWADMDRIPKKVYTWKPVHGKRRPGRPKMSWREVIKKDINKLECEWSVEEVEVAAKDRSFWKYLSRQAAGAVNVRCWPVR